MAAQCYPTSTDASTARGVRERPAMNGRTGLSNLEQDCAKDGESEAVNQFFVGWVRPKAVTHHLRHAVGRDMLGHAAIRLTHPTLRKNILVIDCHLYAQANPAGEND